MCAMMQKFRIREQGIETSADFDEEASIDKGASKGKTAYDRRQVDPRKTVDFAGESERTERRKPGRKAVSAARIRGGVDRDGSDFAAVRNVSI
jgi:hypothetical protein